MRLLILCLMPLALALSACNKPKDNGTETSPQVEKNVAPETSTGGDQQGSTPAQPANP
ncbi:MAG: hypothetical protein J0H34_04210 [Rhizobiales bacterium]|nr:hypothetical protein [Hyphomicrobiales bacterium]